ncbi:MAG: YfhO family protein [Lachnospiraceae bacterium]|nr:YfhO family protein [Lachnospiraceae bacterium]
MLKTLGKYTKLYIYVLAFILPILFMFIISSALHFYPFGELSALVADTQVQFVDYIAYLKSVFSGDNDLFYTFSKTLGGDMAGFTFYYLGNPFIYLLLLCPNDQLSAGILFMIILIMAFSSLNFNIMLNNIFGTRWASVIFSVAYAFMGYFVAYFNFIIYFNNIMLLPIIVLGIYEIINKERISYKYIIFLAASIITNYYIGFMTCIFSVLVFVYICVVNTKELKSITKYFKAMGIYIASSIFAAAISAVALITVLLSLQDQKPNSGLSSIFSIKLNFPLRDLFAGLYTAGFNGNISDGNPIIYCSVLVVVFVFLYFMNKVVSFKEKIATGILLLIMILSFYFDPLNVIWHGFAHPVGFPYRNSFFFSFLLILIGYKGFILVKFGVRKYQTAIIFAIFFIYTVYLLLSDNAYVHRGQAILTCAFLIMILAGVYAICYKREYMYPVTFGFLIIFTFDILINGYFSISRYYINSDIESCKIGYYEDYAKETGEIIDYIESQDDSFYRIDKLYKRTNNDAMYFAYNSLSHFSSCETVPVKLFMGNLGFASNDMWAYYGIEGNTTFVDCLLNLKYMVSQYDSTGKPYEEIKELNNKYIFKNPYALNFAFGCKDSIENVTTDKMNHFTYQNSIAKGITGDVYGIFRPVEVVDINLVNVEKDDKVYKKINKEEEAYIEYELNIDSNDFIYMYFTAPENQDTTLYVNGDEKQPYFNTYNWSTRATGYFEPNTIVPIRINLNQDEIEIDSYEFYYENIDELKRWYEEASKTKCDVYKISSSNLFVSADVDDATDMIVFSMPYDKGWKVSVDGKEVNTKRVLDVLMAVDITPGEHIIEMKYIPEGFYVGSIISAISILLLIIIHLYDQFKINKLIKGE